MADGKDGEGAVKKGGKYRALIGLTFPATAADVKKRKAGEPHKMKRVEAGGVTSSIPPESIGWLLEQGYIEEVRAND